MQVKQRDLTITADNKTKTAGSSNPPLTFSAVGFAPNESAANFTTQPMLTTTAVTNSPPGMYPITVGGAVDGNYNFHYVAGTLNVTSAGITTTTKLYSSKDPSTFGDSVTFTAVVTAASGRATPGGTVTFFDGTHALGTVVLHVIHGVDTATFTTSSLVVGTHPITAVYNNSSPTFASSTSPMLNQVVKQAATTTKLSASCGSANYGQNVTVTAVVQSRGGTPSGSVTFYDGSTVLQTVPLVKGRATYTTSSLAVGTHSIRAVYSGSPNFAGSTSNLLRETIENFKPKPTPFASVANTPACRRSAARPSINWRLPPPARRRRGRPRPSMPFTAR